LPLSAPMCPPCSIICLLPPARNEDPEHAHPA
jgi:hypothetical protein